MAATVVDLCLAATVAGDLGVASDATVQRVVTAASRAVATFCGRRFERELSIVETPASYGRPLVLLERYPILAVTSVLVRGAALAATEYRVEGEGLLRIRSVWPRTARDAGDITAALDHFHGDADVLKVTYDAGYVTPGQAALAPVGAPLTVTLPEDVQEAAILVATGLFKRRTVDASVASESLGTWSVSYRAALPLLVAPEVEAMLGPYINRRVS